MSPGRDGRPFPIQPALTPRMTKPNHRDQTLFHRPGHLRGVELVHATYKRRSFPLHAHPEYVVGTLVQGRQVLRVDDREHLIGTGEVLQLHPGEAHANRCIGSEVLSYRVFYLPEPTVSRLLQDDTHPSPLRFSGPRSGDRALGRVLRDVHRALWSSPTSRLEQEALLMTMVHALASHNPESDPDAGLPSLRASILRARDFVDEHFRDDFGLEELATASGLSIYRVAHLFRGDLGLSPIAYRNQRRVFASRTALLEGRPIADVALEMGYCDQSHFTRHFQRVLGVSPGKYAQQ